MRSRIHVQEVERIADTTINVMKELIYFAITNFSKCLAWVEMKVSILELAEFSSRIVHLYG